MGSKPDNRQIQVGENIESQQLYRATGLIFPEVAAAGRAVTDI